ncbi:PAS domain S-box protein [Roseimarinus sediminis]|uniref:PAS domain S-box protein n=1 Tax=Roseimarinus sediminis TaxID=1610899 RepID=UPI003D19D3E7
MNVLSGKIKGVIYGLGSLILLLLLFESLIYLWKQKLVTREQNLAAEVAKEMTISFERELSSLIYLNSGLEAYLKLHQHQIDSLEVQELLRHLHAQSIGHIRNLAVARGTRIAWIYLVEGNEAALGHDYRDVPDQWPSVQKGIESGEIVMDGPLELIQGGIALIFRKPVFFDSLYWGMLSTVIDVDSLMQSTFGHIPSRNFNEAVVVVRSGQVDCLYGDPAILEKPGSHRFNMRVYGSEWLYVLEPAAGDERGALLRLLIWAGRLLMVLLSVGAGYFFIVRSRSIELGKKYRLFFEVVEQSPVSIMITTLDGSIDYVNPACQLTTGYKSHELLGRHPNMLKSTHNPDPDDEELWQNIQKGEKWQGVFENQKKDGSLFWERAIVFPMLNRRGEAIKYIAIKEDITEKIETEA